MELLLQLVLIVFMIKLVITALRHLPQVHWILNYFINGFNETFFFFFFVGTFDIASNAARLSNSHRTLASTTEIDTKYLIKAKDIERESKLGEGKIENLK